MKHFPLQVDLFVRYANSLCAHSADEGNLIKLHTYQTPLPKVPVSLPPCSASRKYGLSLRVRRELLLSAKNLWAIQSNATFPATNAEHRLIDLVSFASYPSAITSYLLNLAIWQSIISQSSPPLLFSCDRIPHWPPRHAELQKFVSDWRPISIVILHNAQTFHVGSERDPRKLAGGQWWHRCLQGKYGWVEFVHKSVFIPLWRCIDFSLFRYLCPSLHVVQRDAVGACYWVLDALQPPYCSYLALLSLAWVVILPSPRTCVCLWCLDCVWILPSWRWPGVRKSHSPFPLAWSCTKWFDIYKLDRLVIFIHHLYVSISRIIFATIIDRIILTMIIGLITFSSPIDNGVML